MRRTITPESEEQESEDYFRSYATVFLAGSIEMGEAEDWQTKVINSFDEKDEVTFFNPRRDAWDSSWEQAQSNPQFNHQVNWELNHLDSCDIVFMNFIPGTKSPISLLELGAYGHHNKMIVCCPEGFWRKGNVDIFCTRQNIQVFTDLTAAIGALRTKLETI
jgi:hypothetical protein